MAPCIVPAENRRKQEQAAAEADQSSSDADLVSGSADVAATGRDDAAADRELLSTARDTAATARDRAAEELELAQGPGGPEYEAAIKLAAEVREMAATDRLLAAEDRKEAAIGRAEATLDRERAASDRKHAAMDRDHAAMDRRQAMAELEKAHTDDLTGAYRRGAGLAVLQTEVDRAQRTNEELVLAFVDVNGLKATNDNEGHTAGDHRLRELVNAMRAKTRTYEPIVRYGGDEFLCSFAGVGPDLVAKRFAEIDAILRERGDDRSMSFGLATLGPEDKLEELIDRADAALISVKRENRHDRRP